MFVQWPFHLRTNSIGFVILFSYICIENFDYILLSFRLPLIPTPDARFYDKNIGFKCGFWLVGGCSGL
jgi:hypothetical protein